MDIAVTDSGIGGLFVVKKLFERTRAGKILYLADNAHAPYGRLPELQLQKVMRANCARLKDLGAKTIVLACNTATAVCIDELRAEFSDVEFVGTEPAIKPAAAVCDRLTVMATPLTLAQPRFAALLEASGAKVCTPDCSHLAHLVEYGLPELKRAKEEAERILTPYAREGLGAVVIGCTHYSHLADFIEKRFHCPVFDGADGVVSRMVRSCEFRGAPHVDLMLTDPSEEGRYRELLPLLLPKGASFDVREF